MDSCCSIFPFLIANKNEIHLAVVSTIFINKIIIGSAYCEINSDAVLGSFSNHILLKNSSDLDIFFVEGINLISFRRIISDSLHLKIENKPEMIMNSSEQLVKEIQTQRALINAEQGTLSINRESKIINEALSNAFDLYKDHKLSKGKYFSCSFNDSDTVITTYSSLLIRSLGNLIINVLEVTEAGGTVKLYSEYGKNSIKISVFNDKSIPENIQMQIFQRSFST